MTRIWVAAWAWCLLACSGTPPVGADAGTAVGLDGGLLDSGTGGGSGMDGGSDAGVDAGADAGADAGTDAGTDGGAEVVGCAPMCGPGRTCRPAVGQGVCEPLVVTVDQPVSPYSADAGTVVTVVATVKEWDGGAWSGAEVPVSASPGTFVTTPPLQATAGVGGRYEGAFTMPSEGSLWTLTVGWADAKDEVTISTQVCSPSTWAQCQQGAACVPSAMGGACVDRPLGLEFLAPAQDARVKAGEPIPVRVRVVLDGGLDYPWEVPVTHSVTGTQETLSRTATRGEYEGTIAAAGTEGNYTLTAGWVPSARFAARSIFIDALPPQLGLSVASDGGAYQRDAIIPAVLTTNEPLADAGLWLGGIEMPRLPMSSCPVVPNAGACFELDFSKPALNALSGNFTVEYAATDVFEHPTARLDGGRSAVTRVRWTGCPAGCVAGTSVTGLAVAPDGGLIVGVSRTTETGAVALVSAGDGGTMLSWESGAIQSLAAHGDVAYFAMNERDGGRIGGFAPGGTAVPCFGQGPTYSGIALVKSPANLEVGAVGSTNSNSSPGSNGRGCRWFPVEGSLPFLTSSSLFDSFATTSSSVPSAAVNVLVVNAASAAPLASFLSKPATVGATWRPVEHVVSSMSSPSATNFQTLTSFPSLPPVGQALLPGGGVLMTADTTGSNNVFMGSPTGFTTTASGNLGAAMRTGVPAVASSTEAYVGRGGGFVRFDPNDLTRSTDLLPSSATADTYYLSPVLTRLQDGGVGSGYAVSGNGNLVVFGQRDGGLHWQQPIGDSVVTHPAFDCNRQRPETKTGILYVGGVGGRVRAIIVDSPKLLDTPGAWPKYQRSMGNAGNDDLANFPTNWPGCP